jgi:putative chitinase
MSINPDQLRKIWTHAPAARCAQFAPLLSDAMARFGIDTEEEIVEFIAQISHESGEGQWLKELASGVAYEGRKDLGNTEAGDGVRYKGRGLIQCTGRVNYVLMGMLLKLDLIANPELLEEPKNATDSAAAFWWNHKLDDLAIKKDFVAVTKVINGGTNGLADRQQYLARARAALMETA